MDTQDKQSTSHNNNNGQTSEIGRSSESAQTTSSTNQQKTSLGTPRQINLNLNVEQVVGISGCVLILIGMFLPVFSTDNNDNSESFNYIDGSLFDQWFLILLLVAIVPLVALKQYRFVKLISAVVATLMLGKFLFLLYWIVFSNGLTSISDGDHGQSVGFGWIALLVGLVALMYSSFSDFFNRKIKEFQK
jgi:hypothetical protein